MGAKKPVQIGARYFEKQGDAHEFFRRMLWNYSIGERVSEEDSVDLRALLMRHRDVNSKIGPGVHHFLVTMSEEGSRCFAVARADLQIVGFSYVRCVSGRW